MLFSSMPGFFLTGNGRQARTLSGACQLLHGVREVCTYTAETVPGVGKEISVHSFKLQNVYSVHSTVKEAREVCLAYKVI